MPNLNSWNAIRVFVLLFLVSAAPVLAASGDSDQDGDVDSTDFLFFETCQQGPEVSTTGCAEADFDGDGAIDMRDFAEFQRRYTGDGAIPGNFDVDWIHGSPNCGSNTDPAIQVHQYNANTYILRQNKCLNFEAPFMYLFLGEEKALLQDTGATASAVLFPIQATVQTLIDAWVLDQGLSSLDLIVSHSHWHGDHAAGDGQFIGQPNTTVVGTSSSSVQNFFGITNWPTQIVSYDLGGRVLDVIPIPGHHSAHIALYDRQTDWLLTGDSLYPGRLYISSFSQYQSSIQRLVDFSDSNAVSFVMGTHVEMSAVAGVDYPIGTTYQPNEHVLQLGFDQLIELNTAVQAMGNNPVYEVHDEFIIFPF